jgi:succinate dehydrogenase / fumarate reductase flavoprotein subunit
VLATGGIGKAYSVTSNSWEYSGDGHALAYEAGAELIDMEFVQFHPTGMVWPPGVRGLLVTEAVRGEGGILRTGRQAVHVDYLPEDRRGEYAATDDEAALGHGALRRPQTDARRPPELSTRDNVARAIYTEVKEGRGHRTAASSSTSATCRRPRPAQAALDVRAVQGAGRRRHHDGPMEVGPTTHYVMGGIRSMPRPAPRRVAGLFAAGEVAGGMHGANRLGGNSLSDLLVFGAGPAPAPRRTPTGDASRTSTRSRSAALRELEAPLERTGGRGPYAIQRDLQAMMQRLVGIFRIEADLDAPDRAGRAAPRWAESCSTAGVPTTPAGTSSSSCATC